MFQFLLRYSPDYAKNNLEGWSVILVVAAGFAASTLASSWLGMLGMFFVGVFGAHVLACAIKFVARKNKGGGSHIR